MHIVQDNTGDHLIISRDVPGGPELHLECHGYDIVLAYIVGLTSSLRIEFSSSPVKD